MDKIAGQSCGSRAKLLAVFIFANYVLQIPTCFDLQLRDIRCSPPPDDGAFLFLNRRSDASSFEQELSTRLDKVNERLAELRPLLKPDQNQPALHVNSHPLTVRVTKAEIPMGIEAVGNWIMIGVGDPDEVDDLLETKPTAALLR